VERRQHNWQFRSVSVGHGHDSQARRQHRNTGDDARRKGQQYGSGHAESTRHWLGHGHGKFLYGDDGEMQCQACGPTWDYKRDPLESVVRAALFAARHAA